MVAGGPAIKSGRSFMTAWAPPSKQNLHIFNIAYSIISCNSEYSQMYTKNPIMNIQYRRKDNTTIEYYKKAI